MPPEAWFWCSLLHGITVFTFPDLPNQCQTWWPKASEIESYGCLWEHKDEKREVQKTSKKRHHKSINKCHKYAPKGGSPRGIFFRFLGSPSQDGLQGVPRQAPRPQSMLKWRPWDAIPGILAQLVHTLWRHVGDFPSINEACIPSLRCQAFSEYEGEDRGEKQANNTSCNKCILRLTLIWFMHICISHYITICWICIQFKVLEGS